MSKIVITGGLGYIGTQLSKLYIEENLSHDVHIVDRKFLPERVKELKSWGFKYHQSDLLNKEFFEDLLKDADVVYHLGGVTDVAYVKSESNDDQDKEIREVGVDGTNNIIESVGKNTKVIFPSTHVVYEGFGETAFDIEESVETCPVLTYSKGKVQSEEDLENSSVNYVVLRLGSVYGYGGDSMRINIMPNLFSKMAATGNPIKLFGGGVQWKSLVSLFDVARCMKFVAEQDDIQRQVFHLRNENIFGIPFYFIWLCNFFIATLSCQDSPSSSPTEGADVPEKMLCLLSQFLNFFQLPL